MSAVLVTPEATLRQGPFPFFAASRVLSSTAFQIAAVALGWMIYDRTGSAYMLGLVGLAQFLPIVLLTFVVGHVADRFSRQRIVVACQRIAGMALLLLAIAVLIGGLGVAPLFVVVVLLGACRAFEHPTLSAFLPTLLPPALLPKALTVSSSVMQTAVVIGPSLGGLLYALGPFVPLLLACACYLGASFALGRIPAVPPAPRREPVSLASVFSGVAFIASRPALLGSISLDLFAVLLGGATALLPIFARDILHTGPWGLGLLRSAPAVGAVLMSLVLTRFHLRRHVGLIMFAAVITFGLATIVFSASTHIALSLAALFVLGAADNISVVIRSSLVQLGTPDEMRGRVSAVNSLFIGTSNQLGEFESGMTAGLLGTVPASILGGLGTIVVALLWMRLFPALRRRETLSGQDG